MACENHAAPEDDKKSIFRELSGRCNQYFAGISFTQLINAKLKKSN